MPTTYDLVISGCSRVDIVVAPGAPSGYRRVINRSDVRMQYIGAQFAVREAKGLLQILQDNPEAIVTRPDGESFPLSEWVKNPQVPVEVVPEPEPVPEPPIEDPELSEVALPETSPAPKPQSVSPAEPPLNKPETKPAPVSPPVSPATTAPPAAVPAPAPK
jgi:hypothetical protein